MLNKKWKITPWEPSDIMVDQEDHYIVADCSDPNTAEHLVKLHNRWVDDREFASSIFHTRCTLDVLNNHHIHCIRHNTIIGWSDTHEGAHQTVLAHNKTVEAST